MSISEAVYTVGKAALNNVSKNVPIRLPDEQLSAFNDAGARAVIDATWGLLMKQQKGLA